MWTVERVLKELDNLAAADNITIDVLVCANGRLSRTLGRVHFNGLTCEPTKIEFSRALLENGTDNDVINVIKHEYVHYFLLVTTGIDHGHDDAFRRKCAEIGCEHDQTHNKLEREQKYKYEIWCLDCNEIIGTRSRRCKMLDEINFCYCGKCKGKNLKVIQNW